MRSFSFLVGASLLAVSISGCESRFVESSPASVKIEGLPLSERLSQKGHVDSRIEEIQKGAEKAKRIIEMFKEIQNPSNKEDVYTPIDFLLDVNKELKSRIPENKIGKLVRRGKIVVPVQGLSEDCKIVETLLESSVIYDDTMTEKSAIGERLTYSLKTCGSEGEYLSAIEANWVADTLEFRLVNKNLENVFRDIFLTDAMENSVCKIKEDEKKIIDFIHCENFKVKLSASEFAFIRTMAFNNSGSVRFESVAEIFENDKKKANSAIKILSNGEVDFKVKKVGEVAQGHQ